VPNNRIPKYMKANIDRIERGNISKIIIEISITHFQ
jgi:hypothetical protein